MEKKKLQFFQNKITIVKNMKGCKEELSKKTKVILGLISTVTPIVALPFLASKCESKQQILNKELAKVKATATTGKTAAEVKADASLITFAGFDTEIAKVTDVVITDVEDTDAKVKVSFKLAHKNDEAIKTESRTIEVDVVSQKAKDEAEKAAKLQALNTELAKVSATATAEKTAAEVKADTSLITFAGFDTEIAKVTDVVITDVEDTDAKVKVSFKLAHKNDEAIKTESRTIEVDVVSQKAKDEAEKAEELEK
ncbi:hypothetical protein [[Mycoplasma] anseris]|uniref:Uncharacterized protein n=1 Tax=[Mycoplasma] anseris TaxID=92400 RepID=A0A2Z4ND64_9BACT|nr:hypothetical protein [[Mycoplasma] anseris]AWX69513.1 hypothetical protein DP065_01975 [[Mycoplasma] anseris]